MDIKRLEKHEPSRERLFKKRPELRDKVGITEKGLYRHNPETGFNELISKRTGEFTGKSPFN
jgi:hypothetical protein